MEEYNTINCDVSNCVHNNTKEGMCGLDNLTISSSCDGKVCDETSSTFCQSFESSGGIIGDTEYEVSAEFDPDFEYKEKEAYI